MFLTITGNQAFQLRSIAGIQKPRPPKLVEQLPDSGRNVRKNWRNWVSLANCYFAHNSPGFPLLLRFCDAQLGRANRAMGR
jgi:hypothetical protein